MQANVVKKAQGITPGDRTYKPRFQNFNDAEKKDKQAQHQRQGTSLNRMINLFEESPTIL